VICSRIVFLHPTGASEEALARGDWAKAAGLFAEEIAWSETAKAHEGYATACWWLDDGDAVIDARSRAYALYRAQGDRLAAARVATALSRDFASFRGQLAVAAGWLRRAHRLLGGFESSEEHGWLAVREAEAALFYRADTTAALAHAADAAATAELL
jgi:LuxR family maltose regulon positive regulatory protein